MFSLSSEDAESESLLLPVKICIQTQSLTMSAGELSPQTESVPPEDVLVNADVEPVVDEHEGKVSPPGTDQMFYKNKEL